MKAFLEETAEALMERFGEGLKDIHVVLPSRRAVMYFKHYLVEKAQKTVFAPEAYAFNDFLNKLAGVEVSDGVFLLLELFDAYRQAAGTKAMDLDSFVFFGGTLLEDFNMLDKCLRDEEKDRFFDYMGDVQALERWAAQLGKEPGEISISQNLKSYLEFWDHLKAAYANFKAKLAAKNAAYSGMAYRAVSDGLKEALMAGGIKHVAFAGFNQLTPVEEKIIRQTVELGFGTVFWDIDSFYLNDNMHEAGYYIRKFKQRWPGEFNFDRAYLGRSQKNIQTIGVVGKTAQAKAVGKMLIDIVKKEAAADWESFKTSVNHTAILLPDESMLLPLLYSLPESADFGDMPFFDGMMFAAPDVKDLVNITMGLGIKNSPMFDLIDILFDLQENKTESPQGGTAFYYKNVVALLKHPFFKHSPKSKNIQKPAEACLKEIHERNLVFIEQEKLNSFEALGCGLFAGLFRPWNDVPDAFRYFYEMTDWLSTVIDGDRNMLESEFLLQFYQTLKKLETVLGGLQKQIRINSFKKLLYELLKAAKVPFVGEPLAPIQIMGMLESRALDFKNVIVLSCNEGLLPKGKSVDSIIPFDVKKEFGLPTYQDNDAAFAYSFYRIFNKAENITLIYTEPSDIYQVKEKSRFLTQIEEEIGVLPLTSFRSSRLFSPIPEAKPYETEKQKSPEALQRLKNYLAKGISPSGINSYLRSPLEFYHTKVLGLYPPKKVEETMEANTLGNAIHWALEEVFKDYIGKELTKEDIDAMRADKPFIENLLDRAFAETSPGAYSDRGENFLLKRTAVFAVQSFLEKHAEEAPFLFLAMEKTLSHSFETKTIKGEKVSVLLKGIADRIDFCDGFVRVVDYKTGRFDEKETAAKALPELLVKAKHDKIVQMMLYKYMLLKDAAAWEEFGKEHLPHPKTAEIRAGFYFLKANKSGFVGYMLEDEPQEDAFFFKDVEALIACIVNDMLDESKPFKEEGEDFSASLEIFRQ